MLALVQKLHWHNTILIDHIQHRYITSVCTKYFVPAFSSSPACSISHGKWLYTVANPVVGVTE